VIVKVTINDLDSAVATLKDQVVPNVSQAPGFVGGYWMRKDASGLSVVVFESEAAAQAGAEQVRAGAVTGVTIEDVEVREVVAHA
jgi:heme-degrading monooxygenase HmoA